MLIDTLMNDSGASAYYDEGFRIVLEDHMSHLRVDEKTATVEVDAGRAYKYEYDLFGLLQAMNIQQSLHWLIMRMNKMTAPFEYRRDMLVLLLPDPTVVGRLLQSHNSTRRIT